MIDILKKPEQVLRSRFGRRGFSLEECRKILGSKKGDVTYIKQRSYRKSNLADAASFVNC